MEKIIPAEGLRGILAWPVTGLFTGTPVLIRKLTAPQRARRTEAAQLKAKQAELTTQAAANADAEFAKKVAAEPDPAKKAALVQARETAAVAARTFELDQAKAARKEKRSKLGDAAGAGALLLIVGGPLVWSLARPLIGPGVGLLIGVWWIAALVHAPSAAEAADEETTEEAPETGEGQDEEEPAPVPCQEPTPVTPGITSPTAADARLAVALLGAAGTHVALTAVTAHLAAEHPRWKRSGKAVRALLQEARVEVRGGVRVDGVSVPGIHRDDVPPLPSPSEGTPHPVVVAGQSNNNNANNTQTWSTREGFVLQADPDNPARTIVVHSTAA
ncbi:hypothetical protein [Kitasatospora cineracea]|uniref:Uncharacterized protein n=1 Tax=Kitasatospora cineracea TaxID=88074 RepID=A0A3N4RK03_9ACTN|nr:hypothetical protein [Kitasatospora cineracea]RPE33742.1 hypothetical protein EDD38_2039 [Kitasatospora cineracea]